MLAAPLTDLLLHGGNRKYRSIRISTLVEVIFALATQKSPGRHIHEHDAMLYALRRLGKARPAN